MKRFNDSKIMLLLLAFMLSLMLITESANADFTFGTPISFEGTISGNTYDGVDCFSSDGLEMYIESSRAGGSGEADLWVSTRSSVIDPWEDPVNLGPDSRFTSPLTGPVGMGITTST
jgi:hypothetical protein